MLLPGDRGGSIKKSDALESDGACTHSQAGLRAASRRRWRWRWYGRPVATENAWWSLEWCPREKEPPAVGDRWGQTAIVLPLYPLVLSWCTPLAPFSSAPFDPLRDPRAPTFALLSLPLPGRMVLLSSPLPHTHTYYLTIAVVVDRIGPRTNACPGHGEMDSELCVNPARTG